MDHVNAVLYGPPENTEDLASSGKTQLILAAERLFARLGVEGASLREIASSAGHGNNNAVRYHFGSKDGLIQAVFRHRVTQMEPLRRQLLATVDEQGLTGDARSLLEVIVLPHLTLRDAEGRFSYASFLLQYLLHYRPAGMTHAADDAAPISPSLHRAMQLLRQRLYYLPPDVVDRRIMVASSTFMSVLLNTENRRPQPTPDEFKAIIDDTLEQMVSAITAPASRFAYFLDDRLFC